MTTAAANAAVAMSMAKEISCHGRYDGVQELVQLINSASLSLIQICENKAHDLQGEDRGHLSVAPTPDSEQP